MTRVFIGRLSMSARESDVERFLRGYGKVRDISLKRGYGFVEFDDYRDADDAIADLNGKELMGEVVALELARGKRVGGGSSRGGGRGGGGYGGRRPVWLDKYGPPVRTQYRVVVENMSSRTSWQDLKDHLRQVSNAKLTYADAHKKRVGEGSVEFETRDDMLDCIRKADNTELGGKKIRLTEDKGHHSSPPRRSYRKSSRSRSRSRSPRSRSRSPRSRSRSRSPRRRSKSFSRSKSRSASRSPVRQKRSRTPSKSPEPARAPSPGDKQDDSDE